MVEDIIRYLGPLTKSIGIVALAIVLGLVLYFIIWGSIRRLAGRTRTGFDDSLFRHCRGPVRLIFILAALHAAMPFAGEPIPPGIHELIGKLLTVLLIFAFAWLLTSLTSVMEDVSVERYRVDVKDNLQARRVQTQVRILKRLLVTVIIILAVAMILMSFERFRQLGTGILASAGLAGLIVGLAAQRALSNLLAGIQIAITQPIRLDDVVIVENEWGRVEEITLTYIVVRIWDLRRLVIPISYFIEKPFQNWTRVSSELLGTVFLYLDYRVPLESVRKELERILEDSPRWDGKVGLVQVTNASERTLEVRALMSAADSSALWELRCEAREKLVAFIEERFPESLPRVRAELEREREEQVA